MEGPCREREEGGGACRQGAWRKNRNRTRAQRCARGRRPNLWAPLGSRAPTGSTLPRPAAVRVRGALGGPATKSVYLYIYTLTRARRAGGPPPARRGIEVPWIVQLIQRIINPGNGYVLPVLSKVKRGLR